MRFAILYGMMLVAKSNGLVLPTYGAIVIITLLLMFFIADIIDFVISVVRHVERED